MQIRILSDIHVEINPDFWFERLDSDQDTTLVVAGDFCPIKKENSLKPLLEKIATQFKHAILVLGNHEFYKGSIVNARERLEDHIREGGYNITVLDNSTYIEDDILFIGSTLWTDYDKENPTLMLQSEQFMTDYRVIRTGSNGAPYLRKLKPVEILYLHKRDKKYIFDTITENREQFRQIVVITHHGPTWQSIGPKYVGEVSNGCYVSDLSQEILDTKPNLWIHGHTHHSADYMVGETRVIINPHGYGNENYHGFNRALTLDI